MRLVLASASPRRADLLRAAGFVFETLGVDVDERVLPGETPPAYVRRLAMEKSARALAWLEGTGEAGRDARSSNLGEAEVEPGSKRTVVLGADTVVVIRGKILGKPADDIEAASMLRQLSGRSHKVLTGISLIARNCERGRVETTVVKFSTLTEDEVQWYVATGEGRDKAGAYAIQGLASRFISCISGSYSNVVGLPIAAVYELVAEEIALGPWPGTALE
jgi:septum formation protein